MRKVLVLVMVLMFGLSAQSAFADTGDQPDITVVPKDLSKVLEASKSKPVLMDVAADWCPPCNDLKPKIAKLHAESKGAWTWALIDMSDKNTDEKPIYDGWNVHFIPCTIGLVDGKESGPRLIPDKYGKLDDAKLKAWVDKLVAGPQPPDTTDPSKNPTCGEQ